MAKAQTYTDDLLLSAVIKYAERFSGKIIIGHPQTFPDWKVFSIIILRVQ